MGGSDEEVHEMGKQKKRKGVFKQLQKQGLKERTELMPKNVSLHHTNAIDISKMAQNNGLDEGI